MRPFVSALLVYILIVVGVAPPAGAQDPAPTIAPGKLNIEIIEGEGAVNNIRLRTAREPIVQVTDENHKPVAGAVVLFTVSGKGAGGSFNGANTLSVTTDAQGRAVGQGFRSNATNGKYQIKVQASYRGVQAARTIGQANIGAAAGLSLTAKILIITAVAAGAAAGGAIAATSGGGTKPTVITAGPPTVGGPR